MNVENEGLEGDEIDPEIIAEAKEMGWSPLEEFRGKKENWVSAEEYVEKGRHTLPILANYNKQLKRDLLTRDAKLDTIEKQLADTKTQLDKLDGHYKEATKRAVLEARTSLLEQLKEAREENDVEAEQKILGELDDVREQERAANKPEDKKESKPTEKYTENFDPEFSSWLEENAWYGVDKARTKLATRAAEDLRDDGDTSTGRAFMEKVMERVDGNSSDEAPTHRTQSRVEGSGNRGSSSKAKTYESLPSEAKRQCLSDADDLVGPDKRYKTLDAWKKGFTQIYFAEDQS